MTARPEPAPFRLAPETGARPRLGLVVLQVDETVEQDFRRLFPPSAASLMVTRIPSGTDLVPETIAGMEAALPRAAALLPASEPFDALGYACTSGTALIGADRVHGLLREAAPARHATDPLTAALAAFSALGTRRIGLLSPYVAEVAAPIVAAFEAAGIAVSAALSFDERVEARVARIDPACVREAAVALGRRDAVEAVFVSCTNLRTLEVIAEIEAETAKPAVGSNLALAWAMASASGARLAAEAPGRLLSSVPT